MAAATAVQPAPAPARPRLSPAAAVVAVALLGGLAVRVVLLHGRVGALDSDEAVVGLMARQFEAGHFRAFYWGQSYGGTLEVALAALAFRVVGATTTALKAVPLALSAVSAILVWRIGRRAVGPVAGAVAGLVVWVWPANYVWWSIKARGFYEATLCLGLAVVLLAQRIAAAPGESRWADWTLLGLCAGLGWWQSPQIAFALVPAAAWLLWSLRWRAWRAVVALPAFVAGSLAWWVPNLSDRFASLTPPPAPGEGSYVSHLSVFARRGLPMTLGLKVVYTDRWATPAGVTIACLALALGLLVAGAVAAWPGGRLVVALLVAFPFLLALLTLSGTVAEGRYTLFLLPWIALCLAAATSTGRLGRWGGSALIAGCSVVTALGIAALSGQTSPYVSGRRIPTSFRPLERVLDAHGITRVWSSYWVAYRLTFETQERIVAAPVSADRYPAFTREVAAAAPPAAHVFLSGSPADIAFQDGLVQRRVGYQFYAAGGWAVYVPDTPVGPFDIPGTAQ